MKELRMRCASVTRKGLWAIRASTECYEYVNNRADAIVPVETMDVVDVVNEEVRKIDGQEDYTVALGDIVYVYVQGGYL